jgi:trigger factor
MDLVLEAIAKKEEIKVESEDLDAEIKAMASAYGAKPKEVQKIIKEQGRFNDLAATIWHRKAAKLVVDNLAE